MKQFFLTITFLFLPLLAFAQTGTQCNQYQSGSTPPAGYGAAWNVLTSARELLIRAACDGTTAAIEVGTGVEKQYIYKNFYRYKDGWLPRSWSGENAATPDWFKGRATGILLSETPPVDLFVAYICQWTGTEWKCGCRDSACGASYWQLQGVAWPKTSGVTIPANACLKWNSSAIASSFIEKWNTTLAGKVTAGGFVPTGGFSMAYSSTEELIHKAGGPCRITDAGVIRCEHASNADIIANQSAASHTNVQIHSSACPTIKNNTVMTWGQKYTSGMRVCLPASAANWGPSVYGGPAILFQTMHEASPRIVWNLRGDGTNTFFRARVSGGPDGEVAANWKIPSYGACYDLKVEYIHDKTGTVGGARFYVNGAVILDSWAKVGPIKTANSSDHPSTPDEPLIPNYGFYEWGTNPKGDEILELDNIWLSEG